MGKLKIPSQNRPHEQASEMYIHGGRGEGRPPIPQSKGFTDRSRASGRT